MDTNGSFGGEVRNRYYLQMTYWACWSIFIPPLFRIVSLPYSFVVHCLSIRWSHPLTFVYLQSGWDRLNPQFKLVWAEAGEQLVKRHETGCLFNFHAWTTGDILIFILFIHFLHKWSQICPLCLHVFWRAESHWAWYPWWIKRNNGKSPADRALNGDIVYQLGTFRCNGQ